MDKNERAIDRLDEISALKNFSHDLIKKCFKVRKTGSGEWKFGRIRKDEINQIIFLVKSFYEN